ncbi:hypothetical protein BX600DRAFT_522175 [Xylariales sp. PMI_506]|nr:hypothetical protein BX600DRAFT_522175 [Xylariales sp. PMI_506]
MDDNADGWTRCKVGSHRFWLDDSFASCESERADAQFYCSCPTLQADPDIAGVGVIIAFIASAAFTLVFTAVCLVFSRTTRVKGGTYNRCDYYLRRYICEWVQEKTGSVSMVIAETAKDVVLSLSDTQLVTGMAMLVAAVIRLSAKSISVYHFSIVTDLVWLSVNTHGLSLLVVRSYTESAKKERRGEEPSRAQKRISSTLARGIRIFLMGSTAVLLLYCCWVSGYEYWYEEFECPAQCTLDVSGRKDGVPKQWMIINFFFILYDNLLAIIMLIPHAREWWNDKIRIRFAQNAEHADWPSRFIAIFNGGERTRVWIKFPFRWIWYFFASELFAFLISVTWFILGVFWILAHDQDRQSGQSLMVDDQKSEENMIEGFGQLVPLVLLILPVLQVFEAWAVHSAELAHKLKVNAEGTAELNIIL